MDPAIVTKIESYLRTESSKNLSLTHFVNANRQFVVEHSPQHNADLQQFWAEALNTSSEKIGVRLVQKRVKPDWKLIAEEVCALTEASKSKSSVSRGTKRKSSSKTDSCELTDTDKEKVVNTFAALDNEKKWKVGNDDEGEIFVEDVMLKHVQNCHYEHAALSLILNIDDPIWLDYFSKDEVKRICEWGTGDSALPKLPEKCQQILDDCSDLVKSIMNDNEEYDERTLEKSIIDGVSSWLETLKTFDKYKEYDEYWLVASLNEFCDMYRWDVPARLGGQSSEIDFTIQIWSQLDKCFRNLFMDTRRDVSCVATLARVNEDRKLDGVTPIAEQQRTVRPDLVLSKGNVEFGAGECGKADLAGIDKKELVETQLHSPKVLKDMFVRAAKKTDNAVEFIRSFKVVGFNQTHMRMSLSVLDSPSGYVCRVRSSEEFEFPTSATLFSAGVIPILSLTLKAKLIVKKSASLLKRYENSRGTAETSLRSQSVAVKETLQIPPSFTLSNKKPKSSMSTTSPTE